MIFRRLDPVFLDLYERLHEYLRAGNKALWRRAPYFGLIAGDFGSRLRSRARKPPYDLAAPGTGGPFAAFFMIAPLAMSIGSRSAMRPS
jgi:hypothetical protein